MLFGLLAGGAAALTPPPDVLPFLLFDMSKESPFVAAVLESKAEEHGFKCSNTEFYTYTDAALATKSVNNWLSQVQMSAQTVAESPGAIQWKASNGGYWDVYAMWESTPEGGHFWWCSGADAQTLANRQKLEAAEQQAAAAAVARTRAQQQQSHAFKAEEDNQRQSHFRIPYWAIVALGSAPAGGAAKSIHKNPFSPDE